MTNMAEESGAARGASLWEITHQMSPPPFFFFLNKYKHIARSRGQKKTILISIIWARWHKESPAMLKLCTVVPEDLPTGPTVRSFSSLCTRACRVALSCSKDWIVPCSVLTEALSPHTTASYDEKHKTKQPVILNYWNISFQHYSTQ